MKESGVDINSFVSEELRLELYSKEVRPACRPLQLLFIRVF